MSILNDLIKDRAKLMAQRKEIDDRIQDFTVAIQALCVHEWYWAQVAGEGRICSKCGNVDYEGD